MEIFNLLKNHYHKLRTHGEPKPLDLASKKYAKLILKLLRKACEADKTYSVFGAEKHKYKLFDKISPSELEAFEKRNSIIIPDEYRYFITNIGNGGAGPYYGIYPLSIQRNIEGISLGQTAIISSDMTAEQWEAIVKDRNTIDNDGYDAWEQRLWQGTLEIGTQGCTYDMLLVITGKDRGRIAYIDRQLSAKPFFIKEMNFLEWYETWLTEVINDYSLASFGYNQSGDEKELISKYNSSVVIIDKVYIINSFHKFKKLSQMTVRFFMNEVNKNHIIDMKSVILKVLVAHDVGEADEVLRNMFHSNEANVGIDILQYYNKDKRERWYPDIVSILNTLDSQHKESALYYLSDCALFDIRDIYYLTADISEDVRKAAIYAMGKSKAIDSEINKFIPFLFDESPRIVHTTIQVVCKVKNKCLIPAYKDVLKKYCQHDTNYIMANLKIAFLTHDINVEDIINELVGKPN